MARGEDGAGLREFEEHVLPEAQEQRQQRRNDNRRLQHRLAPFVAPKSGNPRQHPFHVQWKISFDSPETSFAFQLSRKTTGQGS